MPLEEAIITGVASVGSALLGGILGKKKSEKAKIPLGVSLYGETDQEANSRVSSFLSNLGIKAPSLSWDAMHTLSKHIANSNTAGIKDILSGYGVDVSNIDFPVSSMPVSSTSNSLPVTSEKVYVVESKKEAIEDYLPYFAIGIVTLAVLRKRKR